MSGIEKPRRKKEGIMCPQFRQDVSKVCHTCDWWIGLPWENEKTKELMLTWRCAVTAAAMGQADVVRAVDGMHAATNGMRNEVVKRSISPPVWAVEQIVRDTVAADRAQTLEVGGPSPQRLIGNG